MKTLRFLYLSNECTIGIFVAKKLPLFIVFSPSAELTLVVQCDKSTTHMTRFLPGRYVSAAKALLKFRNRHSTKSFVCRSWSTNSLRLKETTSDNMSATTWKYLGSECRKSIVYGWSRVEACNSGNNDDPAADIFLCPFRRRVALVSPINANVANYAEKANKKLYFTTLNCYIFPIQRTPSDVAALLEQLSDPEVRREHPNHDVVTQPLVFNCTGASSVEKTSILPFFRDIEAQLLLLYKDSSYYPVLCSEVNTQPNNSSFSGSASELEAAAALDFCHSSLSQAGKSSKLLLPDIPQLAPLSVLFEEVDVFPGDDRKRGCVLSSDHFSSLADSEEDVLVPSTYPTLSSDADVALEQLVLVNASHVKSCSSRLDSNDVAVEVEAWITPNPDVVHSSNSHAMLDHMLSSSLVVSLCGDLLRFQYNGSIDDSGSGNNDDDNVSSAKSDHEIHLSCFMPAGSELVEYTEGAGGTTSTEEVGVEKDAIVPVEVPGGLLCAYKAHIMDSAASRAITGGPESAWLVNTFSSIVARLLLFREHVSLHSNAPIPLDNLGLFTPSTISSSHSSLVNERMCVTSTESTLYHEVKSCAHDLAFLPFVYHPRWCWQRYSTAQPKTKENSGLTPELDQQYVEFGPEMPEPGSCNTCMVVSHTKVRGVFQDRTMLTYCTDDESIVGFLWDGSEASYTIKDFCETSHWQSTECWAGGNSARFCAQDTFDTLLMYVKFLVSFKRFADIPASMRDDVQQRQRQVCDMFEARAGHNRRYLDIQQIIADGRTKKNSKENIGKENINTMRPSVSDRSNERLNNSSLTGGSAATSFDEWCSFDGKSNDMYISNGEAHSFTTTISTASGASCNGTATEVNLSNVSASPYEQSSFETWSSLTSSYCSTSEKAELQNRTDFEMWLNKTI